jgi:1-deoxy-D-xylulose 5-phosphate reductoisomerase
MKQFKVKLEFQNSRHQLYKQLERASSACSKKEVKLVMVNASTEVGRETVHKPTIGLCCWQTNGD